MARNGPKGDYYVPELDEAIELYLHRTKMTQADLAADMGMAENTFSWKRRGIKEFTLTEAAFLCDLVKVRLYDLTIPTAAEG